MKKPKQSQSPKRAKPRETKPRETERRLSPLDRYVRALEVIAASPHGLMLTDIAERCQFPPGTAHRIVNVLRGADLLCASTQNPRLFVIGERLLRLAHGGTSKGFLNIAVQPVLNRIATQLENTCFLARLNGSSVESIAWAVPAGGSMRGFLFPEKVMPPHASASAKAILAFQRPAVIEEALRGDLSKLASATLTDVEAVKREYEKVRQLGYATCWGELEEGLAAIACPVAVPELGIVYSVAMSGLAQRVRRRKLAEVVAALQKAGQELALVLNGAQQTAREAKLMTSF
ncbi:MAG TPA: IclR family transcriptional regulator [Pseudolabrys sp.]|nr:IclR family transcriptional regulator [Pseudolabrys sp.]